MFCSGSKSKAKRKYMQGTIGVMMSYVGLVMSSSIMVHRWHPKGWHLYLAAGLPTIPILCLAFIVGRYLREEKDEYQRDLTVQSLLWGTAVSLGLSVFMDFLSSYGGSIELPRFVIFISFWMTVAVVRAIQSIGNRGGGDE